MQYDRNNIFAKILRGELPCNKVYEDDCVLAFHDIRPEAPVHVLVIPKGEYVSFDDFVRSDYDISAFFKTVGHIAHKLGLRMGGYRLVTNHGAAAGQVVYHFHVHILGYQKSSS
ncbi:histidine triad nucleotide-binding protein [Candidatus Anaplasma sp. TIGMIC]|uniref:histidine triad nucleotide-binding protein n=1 Tax=Candidatus Anaplasma sp. TIGMIC TaxID=3020713 RepID=UPI00232B4E69|nr:histidine triad nucleotide-binding protein [Candidatus Anaplasma sp. TIGMIC]MDB1135097.1 histidine triad nucleotide-binding protein [Candidatus Anaplasma sp. TIGMIC]